MICIQKKQVDIQKSRCDMRNKKIIYAIIGIIVLVAIIVVIAIISNKPMLINHTPPEAESIIEALKIMLCKIE